MRRILFILGVLGVMGLASSFKDEDTMEPGDGGCGGGSRVCVSSPGVMHF